MCRQILRRTLSTVLAIAMVLTTMSAAGVMFASANVKVTSSSDASDVTFIVPEAIYLKPVWNSYYQSQQMPFQIYVNNPLDASGTMTLSKEESTQGLMYFNYAYATSVKISFEWLGETGNTVTDGNVTFGDSISRTAGMAYTATPSNNAITIRAGQSPTMSASQTGAYLCWKATYTDTQDKREKTAVAYTYVYKPYVQPVGVGVRTENDRGEPNSFGSILTWISGLHDTKDGSDGERYPNTTTTSAGYGLLAISSSVNNGVKVGNLYAQLASTDSSVSRFRHNDFSNKNPGNWLNESTSPLYVPDKSFRHISNENSSGTGDKAFYTFDWSPVGLLTVDVSRYSNLNQIPNLSVGLMVTDDENSTSGGAWFVSNYTGTSATSYIKDYNTNNTSNAENLWNKYGKASSTVSIIAAEGSYSNPTASEAEGVKFNGRWPRAISTTTSSGLFMVGAGYFNRDGSSSSHYGGDTIWDVAELRANITFYNKTDLRAAVQNAIKKSSTLCPVFYNTSSTEWKNYQNLFKAASMALTKLDGTFYATATVGGNTQNYSTPGALASALNSAVSTLLQGTARVNRTATQTIVGLLQQSNGTYKCIGINGTVPKKTAAFTTFNKVQFSADTIDGYSFYGLSATSYEQSFQVGSVVAVPTSFTTSAVGATITSGGSVTYVHAGTEGTDGNGNLYYTYYYLANPYSVHFDANGGTGTMDNQAFVYNVEQRLTANAFSRRAYTFAGWSKTATGAVEYQDEELVSNLTKTKNGTATLYAIWTPESYTITYSTSGGSLTGSSYTTNYTVETAIGLPGATKPGYTLSGWRANGAGNWGEMTYGVSASVNAGKYGNVTMTAQWTPITYSVVFNGNGASDGSMDAQSFNYDEYKPLTANAFTRNGCNFSGWALTPEATTAVFGDKQTVGELTTVDKTTVTLYAVWIPINYTIAYSAEGGTIRDHDSTYTSRYDVNVAVKLPTQVEKLGYAFLGWKPTADVGSWKTTTTYSGQMAAGAYGNVTLNAVWSLQSYTIIYKTEGGSITSSTYTSSYDIDTNIILPTAQKTGYILYGWDSNDVGNWGENLYVAGSVGSGRYGSVTMTARWVGVTYFIAFDGNNSTDGIMFNQTMHYDEEAVLANNEYVRNGYNFLGWSLSNAATSPTYANGATVSNLSSVHGETVTLFAVWSKITYSIAYDAAGGSITSTGMTAYTVTDRVSLPEAERAGYTLDGWVPESSVGSWQNLTTYSGILEVGNYGDVRLVAKWNKTVYEIRYDAVGGNMSGKYTTEYSVDTTIVLPTVTRTGFAFNGWQADDAWNYIIVVDSVPSGLLGNVVLQAIWVQRNYTVHFDPCGASGMMDDQVMQFDHDQSLHVNMFTYPGYSFSGWSLTEGGAAVYANGATVYNLCDEDGGTINLYAVWTKRSFTISYNLNGASGSVLSSSATMDSSPITLRNYAPGSVLFGGVPYEFSGWAYSQAEADEGMVAYANKASFAVNSEVLAKATVDWSTTKPVITLYAVWTNIRVTLLPAAGSTTIVDEENHLIYGLKEQISEADMRNFYVQLNGSGSLVFNYSGYIGTGSTITVLNTLGQVVDTYTIVIFGDANGDGIITNEDVLKIKGHLSGAEHIEADSAFASACDMDSDGEITNQDMILMKAVISGAQKYDQVTKKLV